MMRSERARGRACAERERNCGDNGEGEQCSHSRISNHTIVRAALLRAHALSFVQKTLELLKTLVSKGFQRALLNLH
jgi:hypothetical protein